MAMKFISGVQDMLVCAICQENMKDPRSLNCHHSFCYTCLQSLQAQGSLRPNILTCPTCRQETTVPQGSIVHLPVDFKIKNLAELISQQDEAAECATCRPVKHKAKVAIAFYCNDCHDYLCYHCSRAHLKMPSFGDHRLFHIGRHFPMRKRCFTHCMRYKDYYCQDCQLLICRVCVAVEHQQHMVRPYEELNHTIRQKVKSKVTDIEKVEIRIPDSDTQRLLENGKTEKLISDLQQETADVKKRINGAADSIIRDVERQRDCMIGLVDKHNVQIGSILSLGLLKQQCNALLRSKDPFAVINSHKDLLHRIDTLLRTPGEKIPELSADLDILYNDISLVHPDVSVGSLKQISIMKFIQQKR